MPSAIRLLGFDRRFLFTRNFQGRHSSRFGPNLKLDSKEGKKSLKDFDLILLKEKLLDFCL